MIALSKVISSSIKSLIRRVSVKVFAVPREVYECTPYGIDSSPIANTNAYFASTSNNGISIIIGYSNNQQKATAGETRIFATNSAGTFQYNIWLRADGKVLIGSSADPSAYIDNLMKYTPFNTAIQAYITAQNAAITTAITGLGGAYVAPPAPNFTAAKDETIKVL